VVVDLRDIEDVILELLAENARRPVAELRAELQHDGLTMPVDSILAAEVIGRLQERVGVRLRATAETARALRSVQTFAEAVYALVVEKAGYEKASA
jgi:acyl carrier protein